MAEKSAEQIESRNKKYLDELSGNIGKYFSYLSTMARFRRKINVNARGVTLIKYGKATVYYDVSETESAAPNSIEVKLWKYDEKAHKKFFNTIALIRNLKSF